MPGLKLAVVADIHCGQDTETKKGTAALDLLGSFLRAAEAAGADALIDLGDRISDQGPQEDIALARRVGTAFRTTQLRRFHLCGNHDCASLTAEDNAAALGSPTGSRVIELAGVQLVFWEPNVQRSPGQGLSLAPGDLGWLEANLAPSSDPTLVFSHVPLSGQSMAGNYWFERDPSGAAYRQQPQIRQALAKCRGTMAAFAGHVHWNSVTILDGVPHFTLQSLTETFTTFPEPAGSFALLELSDAALRWTVHGRDRFEVALAFPRERRRWAVPRGSGQTRRTT
jgi:3',5'-cyclic-AMP phosphodiesterase